MRQEDIILLAIFSSYLLFHIGAAIYFKIKHKWDNQQKNE